MQTENTKPRISEQNLTQPVNEFVTINQSIVQLTTRKLLIQTLNKYHCY